MHDEVMGRTPHKLKVPNVTLTFDLATWFSHATQLLVVMIICADNF